METQDNIIVYTANCRESPSNCRYPNRVEITDQRSAEEAFSHDLVCAEYQSNYRNANNFIASNALPLDCDNDHSDAPEDWITAEDIALFFDSVPYVLHYSRHHMLQKGDRSPRPRFHVIFLIRPESDGNTYGELKKRTQQYFPYFDTNAMDTARFLFGTENPQVLYHPGAMTLNDFLEETESTQVFEAIGAAIMEGSRNSTMSRIGARIIKRYGNTTEAHVRFLREAENCTPPLEDSELGAIWGSVQRFYAKISKSKDYIPPDAYNAPDATEWDNPIPFDEYALPSFPVEVLPSAIRGYVSAVAESTQTAADMAAVAALAVLSVCVQGKYRIYGKSDWSEPLNTYCVIILPPGERKSAVMALMTAPVEQYEQETNLERSAEIIESQMQRAALDKERRMLEDKVSKGKATGEELAEKAKEIARFKEVRPLKLFLDDVTAEKLTSVLAENNGRGAVVSAEGGLFDILNGIYTKNVNIDVFLKGHSGDTIRVDRIGRASESILHPTLTILLAVQPEVLNGLMHNGTFRGRGLNARFLYSMPKSYVGCRSFQTAPIKKGTEEQYSELVSKLLRVCAEETPLALSPEASSVLEDVFNETEKRFCTDLAEISDWAGKYVGAILRIAGLLHIASNPQSPEFVDVSEETMRGAVQIGAYFLEHAKAAYSLMGADPVVKQCKYLLDGIQKGQVAKFSRRDAMRFCRNFKTADSLQPVLTRLCEYGYIALQPSPPQTGAGRRPSEVYITNPVVLEQ